MRLFRLRWRPTLRLVSLKAKLLLAFACLLVVIAVSGGSGWIFAQKLDAIVADLVDVAAPLADEAMGLAGIAQETQQKALEILTSEQEEDLGTHVLALDELKARFEDHLVRLESVMRLMDEGGDTDIQATTELQRNCFVDVAEMVEAQRQRIHATGETAKRLDEFESCREVLDETVSAFARQAETTMNESEEQSKILILNGNATPEELGAIIDKTFNENYPLVKGANKLVKYLNQLRDLVGDYQTESDPEALDKIAKTFKSRCKSFQSQQKRLADQAESGELKTTYDQLTTNFEDLEGIVMDPNVGLFATIQQSIAAQENAAQMQVQLEEDLQQCRLAIEEVVEDARLLNDDARQQTQAGVRQAQFSSLLVVTSGMLIGVLAAAILIRMITRPLKIAIDMLKDIAQGEGDLTKRLTISTRDELGELSHWFNLFVEKLQGIISQISGNAHTLADSAVCLSEASAEMVHGVKEVSEQSSSLTASTDEMSCNINNMAISSEQVSSNMGAIATAIEQMTASIREVAENAENAANVAGQAASLAEDSNQKIGELGSAASEIGQVIDVIQSIAEQTNLLALNATIEAARAGNAGKGFAVVANEVKELARQTAEATEDIGHRIAAIQSTTQESVASIGQISEVILNVNDVSRTIAAAVEQQSVTADQISENISQTALATETVSQGINQTASAGHAIAQSVATVDGAVKETSQGAAQTQSLGAELSQMAETLLTLVGQFKT